MDTVSNVGIICSRNWWDNHYAHAELQGNGRRVMVVSIGKNKWDKKYGKPQIWKSVFSARFEKGAFRMKSAYMGIANVKECRQYEPWSPCVRTPCSQPTPQSTVFQEQPAVPHLVNKLPTLYGTRRFTTAFTRSRHLSLSWATSIHSTPVIFFKYQLYYYPSIYI
jgi:hypothetical protein